VEIVYATDQAVDLVRSAQEAMEDLLAAPDIDGELSMRVIEASQCLYRATVLLDEAIESTADSGRGSSSEASEKVEVAVLDRQGVIVSVNDTWRRFATANGGDARRTGPGISYLDICDRAAGDSLAGRVADAVRAALAGFLPAPMRLEVPCHGPNSSRWFDMLISSRLDDGGSCVGATVTFSMSRSLAAPAAGPSAFWG
jgi:hypothetical protein